MAKLIKCKACGKEVAKGSKNCPSCGKDNRSFFGKHKVITGILVLILVFSIGTALGGGDSTETSANNNETATNSNEAASNSNTETQKEDNKVNYDNFINVEMEMSYEEVVALLGEGTELSSSEVAGIKTTMYTWDGKGISNMNVTVQDGIVTSKAQLGLNDMDANVTLEQYNSVNEGMTYEEVATILGEGQVSSETKILDSTAILYEWVNKNGSNMNAMFQDGTLTSKAQFNLE